ncbi:MAG TPA: DNA-3-methyladenine glycosylase [Anaerolineaceae bacterium]|nr:DNA-3-methyladenine glycosylase [Chloroflexota bacterium]HOF28628.1 DNA-3-methyladenine glycosylase [Anaerolineaceae bacterium]
MNPRLTPDFFNRSAPQVAPDLLGCLLVRVWEGQRMAGYISEVEAYQGIDDQACHARAGRTARNAVMFGAPGRAYVYFTYGMHWMLNLVCEAEGVPAAVLIRAIQPAEGLSLMRVLRPNLADKPGWLNGPAKLTQALGIGRQQNGADVCSEESGLWVERGISVPKEQVCALPRVGIGYAGEPWLSMPWRWLWDAGL